MRFYNLDLNDVYFKKDKQTGTTMFYLDNERALNKWIAQNKAILLDSCEGCLLDNYLFECDKGMALVTEHFVNTNYSDYKIQFSKKEETCNKFWDEIQEIQDFYENL